MNLMSKIKSDYTNVFQYFFFFLVFFLMVYKSLTLPIWIDEGFTLYTAKCQPLDAWTRAIQVEEQSPLYYFAVSLWGKIFDSIIWYRIFSLGFSVGSFFLLFLGLLSKVILAIFLLDKSIHH